MKTKPVRLASLLAFFLLVAPGFAADTLNLSGSDWRLHDDPKGTGEQQKMFNPGVPAAGWIPATVPGNIQADVEATRELRPFAYGALDPDHYQIAYKDWWYQKDFAVPESYAGKRLTLIFKGVDERCQVWLNGRCLGGNAGMYRRFEFDVTSLVTAGATNHLAVQVARMPESERLRNIFVATDLWKDAATGSEFAACVDTLHDLKSPSNFSYDWASNVWTLGIWREVVLEATGSARIESSRVETTLSDNFQKATVHASVEVDSSSDVPAQVEFQIAGHGAPVTKSVSTKLAKGCNTILAELPVEKPALWWPNGQGDQPLYTLTAKVIGENGAVSDTRLTSFGIREVKWIHTEGAPENFVSRYQLVINGRPVRTIGSGLIGSDVYLGCGQAHQLDLLRHAKALGMNTFRLNGGCGGPSETEEWFALADRLGIMISYEVPIGNVTPPEDKAFLSNLEKDVRCMILESRNHPSVIEYAGGNEMPWNSSSTHPALLAMRKVAQEETDRLFRATCPDSGAKHGPWVYNITPKADASAATPWWGPSWHAHFNKVQTMRYGEFGTSAPAVLEVWKREIPPASQWPIPHNDDPVLIRKNATRGWCPKDSWLFKPQIDRMFGRPSNLADMIRSGQFLGADGLRYAYDELRRKGRKIGGFTNHCFSEPWCNGAGSCMVDHDGRTWMVYDFLKQALTPVGLALKFDSVIYKPGDGIRAELTLVSDAPQNVAGLKWEWLARDQEGKVFATGEGNSDIASLESKSLAKLEIKSEDADCLVFVELKLHSAAGKLLNERVQIFAPEKSLYAGLLGAAAEKPAAKPVARTGLQVSAKPMRVEGDQEVLELTVTNTGKMTALFCEPHPQAAYRTDLFIDNNNCSIPPGESRAIVIRAAKSTNSSHPSDQPECGLTLAQTGWEITCWNADTQKVAPDASVLFAVGRRDKMCQEFLGKNVWNAEAMVNASKPLTITFDCPKPAAARLNLHTADQSKEVAAEVEVTVNGKTFAAKLPTGLGIQDKAPEHLAYPATLQFDLPADALKAGENTIAIRVKGEGWFTLDSADGIMKPPPSRHQQKVEAVKTGSYDVVLIGDSITQALEGGGENEPLKAVWEKYYAPRHALNLGYSGSRTENILANLMNGELDFKQSPKVFILLIGTNDTDDQHYPKVHSAEEVFAGTKAIVDLIRQRHPTSKIIVRRPFPCGIVGDVTPYHRKYNRSPKMAAELRRAGELTRSLADDQSVFWSDEGAVFLNSDNKIDPALMPDLIHPNAAGAGAAAEALEPLLAKLLGEELGTTPAAANQK